MCTLLYPPVYPWVHPAGTAHVRAAGCTCPATRQKGPVPPRASPRFMENGDQRRIAPLKLCEMEVLNNIVKSQAALQPASPPIDYIRAPCTGNASRFLGRSALAIHGPGCRGTDVDGARRREESLFPHARTDDTFRLFVGAQPYRRV